MSVDSHEKPARWPGSKISKGDVSGCKSQIPTHSEQLMVRGCDEWTDFYSGRCSM